MTSNRNSCAAGVRDHAVWEIHRPQGRALMNKSSRRSSHRGTGWRARGTDPVDGGSESRRPGDGGCGPGALMVGQSIGLIRDVPHVGNFWTIWSGRLRRPGSGGRHDGLEVKGVWRST